LADQIRKLLESFSSKQKLAIVAGALLVVVSLVWLVRWNRERDFTVLYSNLAAEDASAVVAKLKESATEYRLSPDGTTVRVPTARLAEVRLQLASAGIPKSGRIGFELFDRNNFGVTEFTELVNFNRALEGEIERTVMTIAEVESARVHISPAKDSVFLDHRRPAKASVLLKLRTGRHLEKGNAVAIAQLVSNAVDGLTPESVSILDVHGNLLHQQRNDNGEDAINSSRIEYRRNLERDLLAKVNSTLEPLVGADRFRAAISVEVDYSTADQSEESFDPARSVMTSSQRQEDVSAIPVPSGVPGAPSNLPRPTSRPASSSAGPTTRRSENINYQTSRLVKRTHIPHGTVRRISAGILLDHSIRWENQNGKPKAVTVAPSPELLKAARDVVAGVVGLEPDRGDQLVVEALPFEQTLALTATKPEPQAAAPPSGPQPPGAWLLQAIERKDPVVLGVAGAILVVLLAAVALLQRRRKSKARLAVSMTPGIEGSARAGELRQSTADRGRASAELAASEPSLADRFELQHSAEMAERVKRETEQEREILGALHTSLRLPSATTKKTEVLAKHLTEESRKNPAWIAQIIRSWMEDAD
jgi:flagellar M-ring protein FliF